MLNLRVLRLHSKKENKRVHRDLKGKNDILFLKLGMECGAFDLLMYFTIDYFINFSCIG